MITKTVRLFAIAGFCILLSGCWESSEVTFHEPGKYFGASDSLKTDGDALAKRLDSQRDR